MVNKIAKKYDDCMYVVG